MTETVLVGAFAHETNTFVPELVSREDFQERQEYLGPAVAEHLEGTETAVGGVIGAAEPIGVNLVHTVAAFATPGGIVERDTYEFYAGEILSGVDAHRDRLDGVILPLHGAMVAEHHPDGEGALIAAVREAVGPSTPIVVTLDLHGNVSDAMVDGADAIVAYETYPHLDKAATGRLGLEILAETMRGTLRPTMAMERPPTIIFQPRAYTPDGPMAEVMALARDLEAQEAGVRRVNVLPGFYHADVDHMGVTVPVVTDDDPDLAQRVACTVAERIWSLRQSFVGEYPTPTEAVSQAKSLTETLDDDDGPVVMADFGSNPGGGGAANGTTIIREFIDQGVTNAGWAIMHDPEAVQACIEAGVGERLTLDVGGKTDDLHGEPITVDGYVKAITDGRYVNTGTSHSGHGVENEIGRAVRLECGTDDGVTIVLAERRASAFDAEIWRHIGAPPERFDVICIPSLIAFLGDYEPLSSHVILVDTPGLSAVNPARFDYEHIPRPIFPLDPADAISYPDW